MSSNPAGCREQARHCAELARTAATPESREHLVRLQQAWTRLAAEAEFSQNLLELLDQINSELAATPTPSSRRPAPFEGSGLARVRHEQKERTLRDASTKGVWHAAEGSPRQLFRN